MKIVIASKDRAFDITTHRLLKNFDYKIFLHNQQQLDEYKKNKELDETKLFNTDTPFGMSKIRKWILNNYIEDNEWFLMLDDNIEYFTAIKDQYYNKLQLPKKNINQKEELEETITFEKFLELTKKDIEIANGIGIKLIGYAVVDNLYFRTKKYRQVGYVVGKTTYIKKSQITYDENVEMDDYYMTAENLKVFGKVLINNFIFPYKKHYARGGIGTYQERLPQKIKDCKYIIQKYPGLFRYKEKAGCHPKAEIQIKFTEPEQVALWRRKLIFKEFYENKK